MPRIRTIKPEFWQNEQLACLNEHARLLAIALLNHADDKGCFLASHHLVRAACFPFEEDSKNVLGSLQELSRIGYIEVRNCDGKQVGRICKFLDHQRIDKPQKSKLIDIFTANHEENDHSGNVPGIVVEPSGNIPRPERKGREGEQGNGKDTHTHSQQVDESRIDPELLPHWQRYCEWRLAITGKKPSAITAEAKLMDLGRRGTAKAIRDIDFTILVSGDRDTERILDSDNDFQKRSNHTAKPKVTLT
jgi:hypothetical protein